MIGIYQITNLRSGKIYIGQSLDVLARLRQHKYELRHNLHLNRYLQSAWNKYGESNFVFSVLEEVSEEKLTEREKYWVDFYGGYESDRLYNLREPGPSGRLSAGTRKKKSLMVSRNCGQVIRRIIEVRRTLQIYLDLLSSLGHLIGELNSQEEWQLRVCPLSLTGQVFPETMRPKEKFRRL